MQIEGKMKIILTKSRQNFSISEKAAERESEGFVLWKQGSNNERKNYIHLSKGKLIGMYY